MQLDRRYSDIITNAIGQQRRQTRNAITRSYFGHHLIVDDLKTGNFPALLGRKLFLKGIIGEMAAFLNGPESVRDFQEQDCSYWDAWGDKDGKLKVDYGNAWLDFGGVNQLEEVVKSLKEDPNGRRHLISGWKPQRLAELSLPCCHYSYQWYINSENELEMIWNQRSVDIMIGLPSDIVLAAIWNILMAQTVGVKPGRLHLMLGDCHLYESHAEGIDKYMQQMPAAANMSEPIWVLDKEATVFNFTPDMIKIANYNPLPAIKFKLEV